MGQVNEEVSSLGRIQPVVASPRLVGVEGNNTKARYASRLAIQTVLVSFPGAVGSLSISAYRRSSAGSQRMENRSSE